MGYFANGDYFNRIRVFIVVGIAVNIVRDEPFGSVKSTQQSQKHI